MTRTWMTSLGLICALGLVGCGATKPHYPAAAQAQEQLRAAEAAAPEGDTRITHRRLIEQMQREGMWYASLAHIDVLEQRAGPSPELLRLRADALRQTGQLEASRAAYEQLAKSSGALDSAAGLHGLGLLAGAAGDFVQAAKDLEQARQRSPVDARMLADLGYARLRAGQLAQARVPLMQAAQLQPEDLRAQLNLAAWLLASGQPQHLQQAEQLLGRLQQSDAARAAVQQTAAQAREAARGGAGASTPALAMALPEAVLVGASANGANGANGANVANGANGAKDALSPIGASTPQLALPGQALALRTSTWKDARRSQAATSSVNDSVGQPQPQPQ